MDNRYSIVHTIHEDDGFGTAAQTLRTASGDDVLELSFETATDVSRFQVIFAGDPAAKARAVWDFANSMHAAAERLRDLVADELVVTVAERDHERLDNGEPIDITSRQSIPAIIGAHVEAVRRAVHGDRAEETAASHAHADVADDGGWLRPGLEAFGPLRQSRIVGAIGDDLILDRQTASDRIEPGVPPAHDEEMHSGLDGSDFRFVVGCPRCEWDNAAGDRSVD